MVEKIRKFYLSRKLFIVSSCLAIICYLVDAIQQVVNKETSEYAWILMALVILLHWAFLSGHINVQKMLFGAILLDMIREQVSLFRIDLEFLGRVSIMDIFLIVISVVCFVAHMYQQMDHKGRSAAALVNQLLGLTVVLFLLIAVINLIMMPAAFENYVFLFGYAFTCIMIICMETRVEKYKQIRDKARAEGTWTEENRREAKKLFKLT